MGKIDENKKHKSESLLKVAFDLFTEQGINKTSISEIVERAGVAKGTFYLYFRDKYDLRNKLISHKASQLFTNSNDAMTKQNLNRLDEKILFIADNIMDQLAKDRPLLTFISKNLSWGVFKSALTSPNSKSELNFYDLYMDMLDTSEVKYREPEYMLFLIVELVGSSCHDSILYNEPAPIQTMKPYILNAIRSIIKSHEISTVSE